MPIGNGETGLNLWVEEDGDLLFYISRTDAWSECDRLLKLGRVRIALSPNPFAKGQPFHQELLLRKGLIRITAGDAQHSVELSVFVNATGSDIHVNGVAASPVGVTASLESWRAERNALSDSGELESSWTMAAVPAPIHEQAWESPDVVSAHGGGIVWYHRNEHSVVPLTLKHQGLTPVADQFPDTLLHRTFGGWMTSEQLAIAPDQARHARQPRPRQGFQPPHHHPRLPRQRHPSSGRHSCWPRPRGPQTRTTQRRKPPPGGGPSGIEAGSLSRAMRPLLRPRPPRPPSGPTRPRPRA